jgi:hypothetical protein
MYLDISNLIYNALSESNLIDNGYAVSMLFDDQHLDISVSIVDDLVNIKIKCELKDIEFNSSEYYRIDEDEIHTHLSNFIRRLNIIKKSYLSLNNPTNDHFTYACKMMLKLYIDMFIDSNRVDVV